MPGGHRDRLEVTLSERARGRWPSAPPPSASSARRRPPVARGTTAGLPDVRDGLTRLERVVLWQLHELQREFPCIGEVRGKGLMIGMELIVPDAAMTPVPIFMS